MTNEKVTEGQLPALALSTIIFDFVACFVIFIVASLSFSFRLGSAVRHGGILWYQGNKLNIISSVVNIVFFERECPLWAEQRLCPRRPAHVLTFTSIWTQQFSYKRTEGITGNGKARKKRMQDDITYWGSGLNIPPSTSNSITYTTGMDTHERQSFPDSAFTSKGNIVPVAAGTNAI